MAKKTTKKASSKKSGARKAQPPAKKKAKASVRRSRKDTSPAKSSLAILSTGAGAKLIGKMGSAGPATEKAVAKKSRRKSSPLTAKELAEFRELLLQRRHELLGNVSQMRAEVLEKNRQDAAGNLSKFPTNPADLGSDNYELEFTLGLMEGEQEILREIDDALERIAQGVYGICEGTGESIPRTRLKYEPWTRYTVEYASLREKGLIRQNESNEAEETEEDLTEAS